MSEVKLPEWLTKEFVKASLEADNENFDSTSIINFTAKPAVAPGNNFGSNLFRLLVKFRKGCDLEEKSVSVIAKAPLIGGITESLGESMNLFYQRELIYYKKFISETYKLMKHSIVPKHYPSPDSLCLLMEDLESSGYTMVDRQSLLDYDHCRLFIEASAKLHALSVVVSKTCPDLIHSLSKEDPQVQEQIQQTGKNITMKSLLSMVAYLEDKPHCENYKRVINQVITKFSAFWEIVQQMDKKEIRVKALIQVDPWCTNMMFKYNTSGEVTDIKLLDFQNLKFTTPVYEFITFFWLSVKPEVREEKTNDLYHLYCDSLNKNLENLGCSERLLFEDFRAEMIQLSPLVLMHLCSLLPFCIYDGVVDVNQCITEDITNKNIKETAFYSLYSGPAFNRFYPHIFKQAEKEGVFQYLSDTIK